MLDLIEILKKSPLYFFIAIVAAISQYFFVQQLNRVETRIENVGVASLQVKTNLRDKEREELVAYREAMERWEDFLQSAGFRLPEFLATDDGMNKFSDQESELFLNVKIASVRLRTYLRDPDLAQMVLDTTLQIRNAYNPLLDELTNRLIEIQGELLPIEQKLQAFLNSDGTDPALLFTQEDRQQRSRLMAQMVDELRQYSQRFVSAYKPVAEQLQDLTTSINAYIYRPLDEIAINSE